MVGSVGPPGMEEPFLLGQGQAMLAQLWVQVRQENAGLHSHLLLLCVHLQETSTGWDELGYRPTLTQKPHSHEYEHVCPSPWSAQADLSLQAAEGGVGRALECWGCGNTVIPLLFTADNAFQDPQWMTEATSNTELYIYHIFPICLPMIKFNL